MSVHAPVGSFASTGLIHTLAMLALPLVVVLLAVASPVFRRHAASHRDQVRAHFFGPPELESPTAPDAAAAQDAQAEPAAEDDFDYDIYNDTPSP